jgi:hypothetical protein
MTSLAKRYDSVKVLHAPKWNLFIPGVACVKELEHLLRADGSNACVVLE